jgi:hypothetical protein
VLNVESGKRLVWQRLKPTSNTIEKIVVNYGLGIALPTRGVTNAIDKCKKLTSGAHP